MYVSGIINESVVDGEGIRTTIFISGCKHNCMGCHNPLTHNFKYGVDFTSEKQNEVIGNVAKNPLLDGITLSGGDVMFSVDDTIEFVNRFKARCPNLTIWIYTGFTYEQLIADSVKLKLLELCDVLVDGRFEEGLKDLSLPFAGSLNQRIVDIKKSLSSKRVVLYDI